MFDGLALTIIMTTFLVAGAVKGVIGLGLPTLTLGVLATQFDLTTAMSLLIIPSLVTNIWQAFVGGYFRSVFVRIWPFLLMATVCVWLGVAVLARFNQDMLMALLGLLLVIYAIVNLSGFHFTVSPQKEFWVGPLLGATNGVLAGMTGASIIPGVMYLQAIGLPRDMLIQAMGMLFILSIAALGLALHGSNLFTPNIGMISAAAVLPAIAGMAIGQRFRRSLSEVNFRRIFFGAILLLGLSIMIKAVLSL